MTTNRSFTLLASLALAACASEPEPLDVSVVRGPFATAAWASSEDSNGAALDGTLVLEDGCLYVQTAQVGRVLPIFPSDTQWDAPTESLTLRSRVVKLGQEVGFAGGYPSGDSGSRSIAAAPESCDRNGTTFWTGQVGLARR